ncbi:DNA polymerase III subunit beta [Egibacter rhizosphaerae]|uniref:Beta sliding clamp n=1 Tax=Egibacter rhizosphaerae TaxID=1670831 RepID=A0A411YFJ8_9ACTN|nr:DNA polymerase III subunit beta [Egibacter rhizosphaerae]QBI19998.1 DNA polymerase III subunit beta [Egibacter rhizosphaerae]
MKFRAERAEFAEASSWALRTVGARATLPALSGVRLEVTGDRLQFASTDLEISSELSIPVQAEREGVALVPGRLLGDVVRTLPHAAVSAEVDSDRLRLECGRARFELRLMPVEDYPPLAAPSEDVTPAVMKADDFAAMVSQVARAASSDDARPVLTGVYLEASDGTIIAAATDSYRLAVRTLPWEEATDGTVLVPRRALEEARRSAESLGGEVRVIVEPSQVTFSLGDRRLTTRLIEGKFPDYRQLLPEGFDRRLLVDRAALTEVVRRVAVVGDANTTATPVQLHLSEDTVRVTAGSGEVGEAEESLSGELEGEPLQIAFNPRYLTDGLDAFRSDRVQLEFRDELKPAVLRPAGEDQDDDDSRDGDLLYLLMPVRV